MLIGGFQKFTLIDYPKKVAAIVFTIGCNFRCGYCYNVALVLPKKMNKRDIVLEKDFFDFLKSRKNKLEAVVVTGGEPTLQKDLNEFIQKIKKMGFLVKLDTNGTNPEKLKELIDKKLIDYVAMDIKNRLTKKSYQKIVCEDVDIGSILKSINILINGKIDYEFRTTAAPSITKKDILAIVKKIRGAKRYFLQEFKDIETIDIKCKKLKWLKRDELDLIAEAIVPQIKYCKAR